VEGEGAESLGRCFAFRLSLGLHLGLYFAPRGGFAAVDSLEGCRYDTAKMAVLRQKSSTGFQPVSQRRASSGSRACKEAL